MRALVALIAVVAVLGSSCAYRAGTAAAEKFDDWVKDHPIRGARIVDAVGNNRYAFSGDLTAYARLTVEPTDQAITDAMVDLCAFDKVAKVPTTYWLQIETISMQVVCDDGGRAALVGFYDAVKGLTGITSLFLDRTGVEAEAGDAEVPLLAGPVFAAADASGTVTQALVGGPDGPSYRLDGEHVHVAADPGVDIATELAAARDVLPVVAGHVSQVKVTKGLVVAETDGSVDDARGWQATVPTTTTLVVVPAHVTTDAPLTDTARDLVERLSTNRVITSVDVYDGHWVIEVGTAQDGAAVLAGLDGEPGTADLGQLVIHARPEEYRDCYVSPVFPSDGAAEALLALCTRDDVPTVDARDGISVRLTTDDMTPVFQALHAVPDGTSVYLKAEGPKERGSTYQFTTGHELVFDTEFDANARLEALWESTR